MEEKEPNNDAINAESAPSTEEEPKKPTSLSARLEECMEKNTLELIRFEKLILAYVDQKINSSYYKLWVDEYNRLLYLNIKLKRRRNSL